MKFDIHNLQTAPEASKPVLAEVEKAYKFIPNLLGVLTESPLAVAAYAQLNGLIQGKSSLTKLYPLVLAPLLLAYGWRRLRWRMVFPAALFVTLL